MFYINQMVEMKDEINIWVCVQYINKNQNLFTTDKTTSNKS